MKRRILSVAFTLLCATAVAAQVETCSPFVEAALEQVGDACSDMTRNTACYGNISLEAEAQADVSGFQFAGVGDRVDLNALASIKTAALDEINDTWGVAMLSVQANLPDTIPGQNVTMMVYGDTSLEPQIAVLLEVSSGQTANIRQTPSTQGQIVGKLTSSTTLQADGRTEDNQWVRLRLEDGSVGWVNTTVSAVEGDIAALPVKAADDTLVSGTGQGAFYFKSGVGASTCADVPDGGLLLQSPAGTEVELVINDVEIVIGSTIAVTLVETVTNAPDGAAAGPYLAFHTLEGTMSRVSISGQTPRSLAVPPVSAGLVLYVPVDADLLPTDAASFVVPYLEETVETYKPLVKALLSNIEIAAPMSDEDFVALATNIVPQEGDWTFTSTESVCLSGETTALDNSANGVQFEANIRVDEGNTIVITSTNFGAFFNEPFRNLSPGVYRDFSGFLTFTLTSPSSGIYSLVSKYEDGSPTLICERFEITSVATIE